MASLTHGEEVKDLMFILIGSEREARARRTTIAKDVTTDGSLMKE